MSFFFFQAEDGIRDLTVTGVQTCALPIFGKNVGIVVDTHVTRLSWRLGLTRHADAVKIEQALMPLVPQDDWTLFSHLLIHHGRAICQARDPKCEECPIRLHCPSAEVFIKARQTKRKS